MFLFSVYIIKYVGKTKRRKHVSTSFLGERWLVTSTNFWERTYILFLMWVGTELCMKNEIPLGKYCACISYHFVIHFLYTFFFSFWKKYVQEELKNGKNKTILPWAHLKNSLQMADENEKEEESHINFFLHRNNQEMECMHFQHFSTRKKKEKIEVWC